MSIARQEFSDAGRTMLGRANAGELLTFDTMVIGAGAAAAAADLWPLTALIDHRFDVTITNQVDQGDGILILDGVINSVDIPAGQGFNLCELGLMAHIALEAPALYSVANVLATTPDYIPDAGENPTAVHAFKIKVVIDRATNVTVTLGTSTDIIAENMGPAMDPDGVAWPGVFHEKIANTLRFKRLTPGEGIEVLEAPADPFNITIGQKTLKNNLDLYVAAGNPDVSPDFSTLQNAIDHLTSYSIPTNLIATIHCAAEDFDLTVAAMFNHPDGQQISIVGEPVEIRMTTYVSVSNSTNTMILTMDTTGIKVGDRIRALKDGNPTHHGIFIVNAVDATTVTVQMGFMYAFAFDGAVAMEVTVWKTRFNCLVDGLLIDIAGLGFLKDIQLNGSGAFTGIQTLGALEIDDISIHGFASGVNGVGALSNVTMLRGGIGWCTAGLFISSGAFGSVLGPVVFNNCTYGLHIRQSNINVSSADDSYYSVFVNNYGQAIRLDNGSSGSVYHVYIVYNSVGIMVIEHSSLIFGTKPPNLPSIVVANGDAVSGTMNVYALSSSVCHGAVNPGGTLGPTTGSGVDNAYINVANTLLREELLGPILDLRPNLRRLRR